MSNEWDEYASGWDSDPSVDEYAKKAFSTLVEQIDLSGLRVLDFGCGTGALTQLISPMADSVVAIDPSAEMIKYLDKKSLTNVVSIADYVSKELLESAAELNTKFDLIVASSVCSFLPDYEATLNLLTSLLKPGGTFVQWDWLAEHDSSDMGLSKQRVVNAFADNHFINCTISPAFIMNSSKGQLPVLMGLGEQA